ncbi:hypothetical protein O181_091320 [Austropuccinia psidii MF-1]|uniref:Uncharacterized protein n=1 Tax=Austropuccinia psidii MF-1 TaxID=1389203 RepID=A0A9Q3IXJ3_9BASI|nr:hypothetical protein [Austropuccinia psidii MF-1]
MPMLPHCPPDIPLQQCPHPCRLTFSHSHCTLTPPYDSSHPLIILMLTLCPPDIPPMLLLAVLKVPWCTQDKPLNLEPHICTHLSFASAPPPHNMLMLPLLPSPLLMPPLCSSPSLCSHRALPTCLRCCPHTGLILNTAYHPYAPAAPSGCDSNVTPISALTTTYASAPLPLTILMLPWHPQDMPPMPPSTPLRPAPTHVILPAGYHPCPHVLDL